MNWAWLLSGVVLDAALATLFNLGARGFAPSLLYDSNRFVQGVILSSIVIALVQSILLRTIIWPGRRLSTRDLGVALIHTFIVLLAMLCGALLGLVISAYVGAAAMDAARSAAAHHTHIAGHADTSLIANVFVACSAACLSLGGAISGALVAFASSVVRRPDQINIRVPTSALGVATAAVILAAPELFEIATSRGGRWNGLSGHSANLLSSATLVAVAGIPFSLLVFKDFTYNPFAPAPHPVAARRLLVLLSAFGISAGLLVMAAPP